MNHLPRLTQTDIHLTDEQFFTRLDRATPSDDHLNSCAECQMELAALRASLTGLRAAATSLAAEQTPPLVARQPYFAPRPNFRRHIWAASLATVAALFTVSVSVFRPHRDVAVTPVAMPDAVSTVSDEALLDGIQADLSTSIPPSLEPLEVPAAAQQSH